MHDSSKYLECSSSWLREKNRLSFTKQFVAFYNKRIRYSNNLRKIKALFSLLKAILSCISSHDRTCWYRNFSHASANFRMFCKQSAAASWTVSSSEPIRRSRWPTTPFWCMATQFHGSLLSWNRARVVVWWTRTSSDARYPTKGATAPCLPKDARLLPHSQQLPENNVVPFYKRTILLWYKNRNTRCEGRYYNIFEGLLYNADVAKTRPSLREVKRTP